MIGSQHARTPTFRSTAFTFEVASNDDLVIETARTLFGDLLSDVDAPTARSTSTATIVVTESGVAVDLFDGHLRQVDSTADALWAVAREVNRQSLASDVGRIHLHAAALARQGNAALVLGKRRTGKSTLSAHLVR